jgi:hypothetical protein
VARSVEDKLKLLKLARTHGVGEACKSMGFHRSHYYRLRARYRAHGKAGLRNMSRRQPVLQRRVEDQTERHILALARLRPAWGRYKVAVWLDSRDVAYVAPSGVRCVWKRHDLTTLEKRARVAREHSESLGADVPRYQGILLGPDVAKLANWGVAVALEAARRRSDS